MRKRTSIAIASVFLTGVTYVSYVFWENNHPKPEIVQTSSKSSLPTSSPVASQVIETFPAYPPLPKLAESDGLVFDALAYLVGNQSLMKLFHAEQVIQNIVITIDDLPQQHVPVKVMPFSAPAGHFLTSGSEGQLKIDPRNASRYVSYVAIAETIDAKKLVELYVRLYPLFQQAYEELGYPQDNFNDKLNETLDDLLDTPELKEPIKLVQPKYFYLYADPEIEALSVGQKIMLRLGNKNAKIVKGKLGEIRREVILHESVLKSGRK